MGNRKIRIRAGGLDSKRMVYSKFMKKFNGRVNSLNSLMAYVKTRKNVMAHI
jgi:hypothetical protein